MYLKTKSISLFVILSLVAIFSHPVMAQTYKIVDTGQEIFYNNNREISTPAIGDDFYGQDAQFTSNSPSYTDNGDGTITDNVTGLMWTKTPDLNGDGTIDADDKLSYTDALAYAGTLNVGGYNDWRLPSIKEQYSLILFTGIDPSGWDGTNTDGLTPFIDTDYFDFGFGDLDASERIIDAQFATTTLYVGTTMMGDETMFGVNFADGRIKGYGTGAMPGQTENKKFYVYFVRGNENYGINDFTDNANGTISDNATGLMWSKDDSGEGMIWEDALSWVKSKNEEEFLGYSDWRLPNVKELQSIVDYSRSPSTTNSAAINSMFSCSAITDEGEETNYPFYWSGTTHANMQNGSNACYVCFGEALGFMEMPPNSENYMLLDVHGAGAQRSDPKTGNPDDYPYGHGPQGDVIRIYNYVRLVRDIKTTGIDESNNHELYPNPIQAGKELHIENMYFFNAIANIFDIHGQQVDCFYFHGNSIPIRNDLASGTYFIVVEEHGKYPVREKFIIE